MTASLLLGLALAAAAQSPMPYSGEAPAPAAAPAVSTAVAAPAVAASTAAVKTDVAPAKKAKLSRPLHAAIRPEARKWQPLSLRAGGDPLLAETGAVLRQTRGKGGYKGTESRARAIARLHKAGKDRWLVLSVFPRALERRRRHFEVRLRISGGSVAEANAALVSVSDRRPRAGTGLDSFELRAQGVEFEEDSPSSGELLISALDPRPSKSAVNSGLLKRASFADEDAGLADASWSVKGLLPPR